MRRPNSLRLRKEIIPCDGRRAATGLPFTTAMPCASSARRKTDSPAERAVLAGLRLVEDRSRDLRNRLHRNPATASHEGGRCDRHGGPVWRLRVVSGSIRSVRIDERFQLSRLQSKSGWQELSHFG